MLGFTSMRGASARFDARLGVLLTVCSVLAPGCKSASQAADEHGETSKGSATSESSTGVTGGSVDGPDACMNSADCETDGYCAAPYDPASGTPTDARCVTTCIETTDLGRWCVDNSSCCPGLRCNAVDGFCIPTGSTDTGSGSSSGDSTGADAGSSSDSGSSSDADSGTDTTTGTDSGTGSASTGGVGQPNR